MSELHRHCQCDHCTGEDCEGLGDTRSHPSPAPTESDINPTESDGRGYRCLHCELRNDVKFCHYHGTNVITLPEHDATIRNDFLEKAEHLAQTIPDFNRMDYIHLLKESLRHTEAQQ